MKDYRTSKPRESFRAPLVGRIQEYTVVEQLWEFPVKNPIVMRASWGYIRADELSTPSSEPTHPLIH